MNVSILSNWMNSFDMLASVEPKARRHCGSGRKLSLAKVNLGARSIKTVPAEFRLNVSSQTYLVGLRE